MIRSDTMIKSEFSDLSSQSKIKHEENMILEFNFLFKNIRFN